MGRKKKHEEEIDFELNIASIIDCFTVLITYLLVSASFITFGVLDVTVASTAPADESTPPSEPLPTLTIRIDMGKALSLKSEGPENKEVPIPARDGKWDFEALTVQLQDYKTRYPKLEAAMVTAGDEIEYREVVKTVEATRATLPRVALGTESSPANLIAADDRVPATAPAAPATGQ